MQFFMPWRDLRGADVTLVVDPRRLRLLAPASGVVLALDLSDTVETLSAVLGERLMVVRADAPR